MFGFGNIQCDEAGTKVDNAWWSDYGISKGFEQGKRFVFNLACHVDAVSVQQRKNVHTWWRHAMDTLSALLAPSVEFLKAMLITMTS